MYCQFCGAEAPKDLNYCKRCGGSLNPLVSVEEQETPPSGISPAAVWGIGLTTFSIVVFGLIALLTNLQALAERIIHPAAIGFIALFGALVLLGSVAMLTWLWSRLLGASGRTAGPAQLKRPTRSGELGPAKPGALPDHLPSVTEHTTRTFEPAYRGKDER